MERLRAIWNWLMRRDPLVVQAERYARRAAKFEQYINEGAEHLERAFASLREIMNAARSRVV